MYWRWYLTFLLGRKLVHSLKDSSRKSTMYVDVVVELVCAAFDEVI